jgi:hypothetical protein
MSGAVPTTSSPTANSSIEAMTTTRGPLRSAQLPATTMPTRPEARGAAKLSE